MEIDRIQLKKHFETGKRPTQSNFAKLIDSVALVSEIPEIEVKPYKVFSALLRMDNDSLDINRPRYVVRYNLLELNTLGELNFTISDNTITIEDATGEGILTFDRRILTIGTLRSDYNFDDIIESGEQLNDISLSLIFNYKDDILLPIGGLFPSFYNLPIEIRVYNEIVEEGLSILSNPDVINP